MMIIIRHCLALTIPGLEKKYTKTHLLHTQFKGKHLQSNCFHQQPQVKGKTVNRPVANQVKWNKLLGQIARTWVCTLYIDWEMDQIVHVPKLQKKGKRYQSLSWLVYLYTYSSCLENTTPWFMHDGSSTKGAGYW